MAFISQPILVSASKAIQSMDMQQKEKLSDEIHSNQPQLLTAVLAQQRFGASFAQIEVLLNLLLVGYQSMKLSGHNWRPITEVPQERCIARLTGRIGFIDGLTGKHLTDVISDSLDEHKEKWLLAYVLDELGNQGLNNIEDETQKYLVLTALSIVDCIADAGSAAA